MSSVKRSSGKKRNKKYYCNNTNKKRKLEGLEPGLKGFIFTCNEKKEAPVVSEAYALLNEYADALYGPEEGIENTEGDGSEEEENIEKALSSEIVALKDRPTNRRFQSVKTKVKNVLFIKTTLENPNQLTHAIFTDLEKIKIKKSRRCMKFIPVTSTCYASSDAIKTCCRKIFEEYFQSNHNNATFCITFKSRCNDTVIRDELVPDVANIIQELNEEWTVKYKNPDYIIAIDILINVCTIGILKDFERFRKYNLQSMAENIDKEKVVDGRIVIEESINKEEQKTMETEGNKIDAGASQIKDREIDERINKEMTNNKISQEESQVNSTTDKDRIERTENNEK